MRKFLAKLVSVALLLPLLMISTGTASATAVAPHLLGVTLYGTSTMSNDLIIKVETDNWAAGDIAYVYNLGGGFNKDLPDYIQGVTTGSAAGKNTVLMSSELKTSATILEFGKEFIATGRVGGTGFALVILIKNSEGTQSAYTTKDSNSPITPLVDPATLVKTPVVSGTITNTYSKVKSDIALITTAGAKVTLYSDAEATTQLKDALTTKPLIPAAMADATGLVKFKFNLQAGAGSIYAKATKATLSTSAIGTIPFEAKPKSADPIAYDPADTSNTNITVGIKNLFSVDSVVYAANLKKDDTLSLYALATDVANAVRPLVSKKAGADGALTIAIPKTKISTTEGTFYATVTSPTKDESTEVAINFAAQATTDITGFIANSSVFASNTPDSAKVTDVVYLTSYNSTHITTDVVKVYATNEDATSGLASKILMKGSPKAVASTNGHYLELGKKGLLDTAGIINNTVYVTLTSVGYKESIPVAVSFTASPKYSASTTSFVFSANSAISTAKDVAFVYKLVAGDTIYVYNAATADANNNLIIDTSKTSTTKLIGKTLVAKGQSEALVAFTHASGDVYYVVKNDTTEYSYAVKLN